MDNLQTEVLEIEFLSYSNGMTTISEEDFAHILLRYTNVENTSSYLENVRCSMPEEQVRFPTRAPGLYRIFVAIFFSASQPCY